MRTGRNFLALSIIGILFLFLSHLSAHADLITSGFHGIRCYDEQTGAFLRQLSNVGEEQEGIAFGQDGRLFVLINDMGGGWISQYSLRTYTWLGSFGPHDFTAMPLGMTVGPDGDLYIGGNSFLGMEGGIRRIDGKTGADLGVFVPQEEAGSAFDLIFGPDGNLYVSAWGGTKIRRFNGATGQFIDDFVSDGSGGLEASTGIVFGPDRNLYVSCEKTGRVLRYDGKTGVFLGDFVTARLGGLTGPAGLTFGPDGHLYVASRGNNSILRYNGKTGAFIDVFVTAGSGGLDNGPNYIAFIPRPPKITITQTAEGTTVSWPQTTLNCNLQTATTLTGAWQTLTNSTTGSCVHFISRESTKADEQRFFRLKQTE